MLEVYRSRAPVTIRAHPRAARRRPPPCITASAADTHLLNTTMRETRGWPRYENIGIDQDPALDGVITKPWGHEYRVYRDPFFDVWRLSINAGCSTSEHCHPHKSTALICLSGAGKVRFLNGDYGIAPPDLLHIGRGVFHGTENTGSTPLVLIEVEVPRNKLDLVRANDRYGRGGTPYVDPPSHTLVPPPLLRAPLVPNACYRTVCAGGQSRFAIVRGESILVHENATLRAALSLAVGDALRDTITLLPTTEIAPQTIDRHGVYLAISHSD